ncbi:MAG: NAD(P)H-binding protein [Woeseiaceae bacterium]|nr:NAD(P)H-binding protein [Woeseiaceae bacterium]
MKITRRTVSFLQRLFACALVSASSLALADDGLDIVVYGATGKVGTHVVQEALERGHNVTAVSRRPAQITAQHVNLSAVKGDLLDETSVADIVTGADVVIVSVRGVIGNSDKPESALQYMAAEMLVDVLHKLGPDAPRLLHVGGSGTLEVEPGVTFAAKLPTILLPRGLEIEILGQMLALEFLGKVDDVNWTYVTPPKNFTNGPRTAEFRIGGAVALKDGRGRTRLSRADFAVALIDEAERAAYPRQRISVAY